MRNLTGNHGLTIIELLVTLGLFSLISTAVFTMFVNASRNYRQDEDIARMQENGRFALNLMSADLKLTDFWGEHLDPLEIQGNTTLSAGDDCGINIGTLEEAVMYYKYDDGSPMFNPTTASGCDGSANIVAGTLRANTNALAIKRVANASTAAPVGETVYVYTNGSDGCLIDDNDVSPCSSSGTGYNYWQYLPYLYVIRDEAGPDATLGTADDVPYLCRLTIRTGDDGRSIGDDLTLEPADTFCIAEGIEQMHVEFGLDTNDDLSVDHYISDIDTTDAEQIIAIRIYLLARTADQDSGYTNDKTYNMGSLSVTVNDNYYRRVFSTTVSLRNPRAFIGLNQ